MHAGDSEHWLDEQMNRYRLLLATAFFLVGIILAAPTLIGALPDRYVLHLPEPIQKYGLPEDLSPLLPTVEAPAAAAALLITATQSAPEPTATLEPTPTLKGLTNPGEPNAASAVQEAGNLEQETLPAATSTAVPTATATPWPLPAKARLAGVTHKFQSWNNCGPATLAMALTFFGEQISQEQTASILKPNPEDRNVSPHEMAAYVNEQTPYGAQFRVNGTLETLKRLVANDIPVIIETGIEPPGEYRWLGWYGHYLLIVAYDEESEQFWAYDSWLGTSEEPLQNAHPEGRVISYADLATDWAQFNRNYIALFELDQEELAEALIGEDMIDEVMWQRTLARSRAEIEEDAQNPFYWFNLGTTYTALNRFEEAAVAFDQARAIGLPWRMLWYQFGPYEAYLNVGRFDDVVLLADVTLENRPYFEESYYYKGAALNALDVPDGARENFEKAASFNPNFTAAQLALAELE